MEGEGGQEPPEFVECVSWGSGCRLPGQAGCGRGRWAVRGAIGGQGPSSAFQITPHKNGGTSTTE